MEGILAAMNEMPYPGLLPGVGLAVTCTLVGSAALTWAVRRPATAAATPA